MNRSPEFKSSGASNSEEDNWKVDLNYHRNLGYDEDGASGIESDDGVVSPPEWKDKEKGEEKENSNGEGAFQPPAPSEFMPPAERPFMPPAERPFMPPAEIQPDYARQAIEQAQAEDERYRQHWENVGREEQETVRKKPHPKWGSYSESMRSAAHQHERDLMIMQEFVPKDDYENATSRENNEGYTRLMNGMINKFPREPKETDTAYRNRLRQLAESGDLFARVERKDDDSGPEIGSENRAQQANDNLQDDMNNAYAEYMQEQRIKDYNRAHAGEMSDEWRRLSGLEDLDDKEGLKDSLDNLLEDIIDEEARTRQEIKDHTDEPGDGEKDPSAGEKESEHDKEKREALVAEIAAHERTLKDILSREDGLAELYARNRRLFVGKENRNRFDARKAEYNTELSAYLRAKSELAYMDGTNSINSNMDDLYNSKAEEIEKTIREKYAGKTPEEIEAKRSELRKAAVEQLEAEYAKQTKELKTQISAGFVEDFIAQTEELQKATIDKLDNGTLCRKFIRHVLNNKAVRTGMTIAGLGAATAAIIASGGLGSIAIGYSVAGAALGAGKGAFMGGLMARQDSRSSAINRFMGGKENIRKQLESINIQDQPDDIKNCVDWLLNNYTQANESDNKSNKSRTRNSAILGGVIGGVMSGIHINGGTKTENGLSYEQVDTKTPEIHSNIENINHEPGTGVEKLFEELGGDPDKFYSSGAWDELRAIGEANGLHVGESGWTYPGNINSGEWTDLSKNVIRTVSDLWAREGKVPAIVTGGGPVYGWVNKAVQATVPRMFENFLVKAGAIFGGTSLASRLASRGANRMPETSGPTLTRGEVTAGPIPERYQSFNTPETPTGEGGTPSTGEASIDYSEYKTLIGEDGVDFFTKDYPTPLDGDTATLFANWWRKLTEEGRKTARRLAENEASDSSTAGKAVRDWIKNTIGSINPS